MKNILIFGGSGNLGKAVINSFKPHFNVVNVDFKQNADAASNILLHSADVKEHKSIIDQNLKDINK